VIGNLIANNGAISFLIVNQQPQRQHGDNLFVQRALEGEMSWIIVKLSKR
jgi:hypothetical protein